MRDHETDIAAAGATLAAIGTGDISYAEHFQTTQRITFPLLVDDEHVTYRAVEARRGSLLGLANPRNMAASARAVASGHIQGRLGPAPQLLGATHVIHPDGSVPLAWVNDDYADNAPVPAVLAALDPSSAGVDKAG